MEEEEEERWWKRMANRRTRRMVRQMTGAGRQSRFADVRAHAKNHQSRLENSFNLSLPARCQTMHSSNTFIKPCERIHFSFFFNEVEK